MAYGRGAIFAMIPERESTVGGKSCYRGGSRKRKLRTGNAMRLWTRKAHPEWRTSSSEALPPQHHHQLGTKCLDPWACGRHVSFKPPSSQHPESGITDSERNWDWMHLFYMCVYLCIKTCTLQFIIYSFINYVFINLILYGILY